MTTKQKVLACYPHITTRSIHKLVGCSNIYVYMLLLEFGLEIKKPIETGILD